VLPKVKPIVGKPRLGVCDQLCGRQMLGTVPVEADGSAFFEAPVGVELFFHAVDEKGLAVQGMRSATYVAPGETLMCNGCHEQRVDVVRSPSRETPLAMRRAPSPIAPGPEGTCPYSYPRLVQPVLDAKCVSCHGEKRKANMPDLRRGDYAADKYLFYTSFYGLSSCVNYYTSAYRGDWKNMGVQRDAFVQPYTEPGSSEPTLRRFTRCWRRDITTSS
jgi:cytochrome c553